MTGSAEAEAVLAAALRVPFAAPRRVVTELPADIAGVEVIRITKISGTDDGQFSVFEDAILDFDCFAPTRGDARTLAYGVRDWLRNTLPGMTVSTEDGDAFIERVRSVNGPTWLPYDNTAVRRFIYTAQIRIRSL